MHRGTPLFIHRDFLLPRTWRDSWSEWPGECRGLLEPVASMSFSLPDQSTLSLQQLIKLPFMCFYLFMISNFCSSQQILAVSSCIQISGCRFALQPQLSDESKKSNWFLACPAFSCCKYRSEDSQIPHTPDLPQPIWAAITEYYRLGNLRETDLYLNPSFAGQKAQDQGAHMGTLS